MELSRTEVAICRRLTRTGRIFRFLRLHRHLLLNEEFQAKLAEMYAEDYEPGRPPVPPGLLVLVTLLQAYAGVSDADAVHHALYDKRWQMVLDCFGCDDVADGAGKPPFSQGLLAQFRFRLIQADMDRELVRRTVELAKETKDFGYKPLKVALDSAAIWGAGRTEDTFNLIGHALLLCVACAADVDDLAVDEVLAEAQLQVVGKSSVKAALDIDWDDEEAKKKALNRLLDDVQRFRTWLAARPVKERPDRADERKALDAALAQLDRLVAQDVEPDPGGGHRIIDGTKRDRQVSVGDPEMRHGRKSRSKKFNGYKGHAALELEEMLFLDAIATAANVAEDSAGDLLRPNVEHYGPVGSMHIDRAYLPATWVSDLHANGIPVYCKAWYSPNGDKFPKAAFQIDLERDEVRCPGGDVEAIGGRQEVTFQHCATCVLRTKCTESPRGRKISIHRQEHLLQRLQARQRTSEGRAQLRQRVGVEHGLAHLLVYQPHQARYVGARNNTLALRRAAAIVNLQAIDAWARS